MVHVPESSPLRDFKNFLYLVWKHLGLPDPTPVQYEIADALQYGGKRQIIEAYRGAGKSWITSAYVLWCLLLNPQEKILVVSASKQRSDDFSTFTLKLIKEIPILKHLMPTGDQRHSKIAFDVGPSNAAHAPSVKSAGIFGQLAGSRATRIVADDIEVPNNSATEDMREKLLKAVSEFEAILIPEGRTQIVFLGTPQTEESVYNKLSRDRGYPLKVWPARYPQVKRIQDYHGCLAESIAIALENDPRLEWEPTDSRRFNNEDLNEREGSYGRSGFMLQFMLDTSLADAEKYPLKTGDLVVADLSPEEPPLRIAYASGPDQQIQELPHVGFTGDRWYRPLMIEYPQGSKLSWQGCVMAVDPSGRGADETSYAIVRMSHGKLFLVASGGLKGGYDEETVLVPLSKMAKEYGVNKLVIESNFGDSMFTQILKPVLKKYHRCAIEDVRHHTQKEVRIIDTLEPVMNSHRLIVDRRVVQEDIRALKEDVKYSLFHQLTRITKDRGSLRHDDRLDALAIAVNYWIEAMARDEQLSVDEWKEEQLDNALENFMEHVVNCPTNEISNEDRSVYRESVLSDRRI